MYTLLLPLFLLLLLSTNTAAATTIGITYTPPSPTSRLPPPSLVAVALRRLSIPSVRLPGSDPATIRAFSYSNISLFLSIPNLFLPSIASNRSNALSWLSRHLVPFYPRAKITALSVGNDPLNAKTDLADCIIPAIRNVYIALHELGIRDIEVSTTFSFVSVMRGVFPPSGAEFVEPANGLIVKPLLQFLQETNSSFFVNIHPYHLFRMNKEIPVGFALFQENKFGFRDDSVTGVKYRNLFDMMVDAVVTAMTVAGHERIPVVVAETGWPSGGGGEIEANEVYAEMYLRGLLRHLRSGVGTPLRKEGVKEVYVYELFDKQNCRVLTGVDSQQWGVLYPNLTKKYDVEFGSAGKGQFGGVGVVRLAFVLVLVAAVVL
ncbi:hypothetical protein Droror1_Dr00023139 [Drosera rotundifolia]